MDKINFQDGTKVSNAKVTIDGVDYTVTPARYTGATPLSSTVMNTMQDNIEDAIDQSLNNIGGKDYDATSTYDVGDIVKYQGQLYICTTAITTAEAWNSNHWQATDVLSKSEIYVGTEEPTTGEKVWFRKGKNVFNAYSSDISYYLRNTDKEKYIINNSNSITVEGNGITWNRVGITISNLKANTKYTINSIVTNTTQVYAGLLCDYGNNSVQYVSNKEKFNAKITIVTDENGKVKLQFYTNYSSTTQNSSAIFSEIQLEPGSKATSYETYIEPQIFVRNSNGVYEEFIKNNIKEISFTKNDANAIFYESVYATENEVQICGDIRYSYTSGTNLKAFTIDSKYLPIINNENNKLRYPISTDKGLNGYADVNPSGEVYIHTNEVATAAIINIRYRYK